MTEAQIEEVIASYVAAAKRSQRAGFDGNDLLAAYNCLADQFWSPISNRRDDRWGLGRCCHSHASGSPTENG
jgi:2,4-dienoyl-CoA reductase-like NADH-dependent reductase (Old Yellow Enzyme family)